jgi:hypothetical protein
MKRKLSALSKFNYFYIAFVLCWKAVNKATINIDGKSRILVVITIIALLVNICNKEYRKQLFSAPCIFYILWILYNVINWQFTGYDSEMIGEVPLYITTRLLCPLMCLSIAIKEFVNYPKGIILSVLIGFLAYSYIGTFILNPLYRDDMSQTTLGNDLALFALFIPSVIGLSNKMGFNSNKIFYILSAFSVGVVILTAERKALGASFLIIAFYYLAQRNISIGTIFKLLLVAIALYLGVDYTLNNTPMGERMLSLFNSNDNEQMVYRDVDVSPYTMFGSRAYHYAKGIQLFLQHPINGIGLTNFQKVAQFPFRLHTEYMVQLCECGILGTSLFMLFYGKILYLLKTTFQYKGRRDIVIFLFGTLLAILFIGLTSWQYECRQFFVILGLIVGYCKLSLAKEKR